MSLSTIRDQIIAETGRMDFTTDTGKKKLNAMINVSQRWLDFRCASFRKSEAVNVQSLAVNQYLVTVKDVISVDRMTVSDASVISEVDLNRYSREELHAQLYTDTSVGRPVYGAKTLNRISPNTTVPLPTIDTAELITTTATEILTDTFLLFPRSDAVYTLKIEGKFYSPTLALDADVSYWTEMVPEAIVLRVKYMLEGQLRNMTAQRDFLAQLEDVISNLEDMNTLNQLPRVGNRIRRV